MDAKTYWQPLGKFTKDGNVFTLLRLQIITGRRHQIRFHCKIAGYPLVGDPKYGAPWEDREWCPRVFLHSYQTKFREPFTERWFEGTSPLPQDLGKILESLGKENLKAPKTGPLLTRREHPSLAPLLKMYDPSLPLISLDNDDPTTIHQQKPAPMSAQAAAAGPPASLGAGAAPPPAPGGASGSAAVPEDPAAKRRRLCPDTPAPAASQGMAPAAPPPGVNGWTRMASRSQPGVFYYWHQATGATEQEPPAPWEKKFSRSREGVYYYWNPVTGATSAEKPEM